MKEKAVPISIIVAIIFLIGLLWYIFSFGNAVVSWDENRESDIAGYKVYYGILERAGACPPGGYESYIDAGKETTKKFIGLKRGTTYYFSVSAYDVSGNESCFGEEVSKDIEGLKQLTGF